MKRLVTLFILKLIIIECTNADYAQLSCARESRRFIATEGHALIGHVISAHNVILFPECHELCLLAPRCLSYNYEHQSTSSTHVCEINDATDKMCPGSLAKKPGFKYYEEKESMCTGQCPSSADVERANFQVNFPRISVADYVRYDLQRCAPPLTAFTICLWLNVTATKNPYGSVLSYSIPSQQNEIFLTDFTQSNLYIAADWRPMYQAVNNGTWQHVCTTWENAAGSWSFYIDGSLLVKGDNLKTGHVINNTGIFILGQDQDSHGGRFEEDQSFVGQMYGLNMWNRVLTAEEISHMSGNCSFGVGNYLRWSDFMTGLHGDVSKTSPATCLP